jgi:hypothetical protein
MITLARHTLTFNGFLLARGPLHWSPRRTDFEGLPIAVLLSQGFS